MALTLPSLELGQVSRFKVKNISGNSLFCSSMSPPLGSLLKQQRRYPQAKALANNATTNVRCDSKRHVAALQAAVTAGKLSIQNETLQQLTGVIGVVSPASTGAGATTIGPFAIATFLEMQAILIVGVMSAGSTVDLKAQGAPAVGGAYTDLASKAITQMTQAGGDSNKQSTVSVSKLEIPSTVTHVKFILTVGTAASILGLTVVGRKSHTDDTDIGTLDLASVKSVV
jgi:hypothetical protein